MRIAAIGVALVLSLTLAACGGAGPATPSGADAVVEVAATAPSGSLIPQRAAGAPRTLVTGLEVPWGLAFFPDGSALVTERESARLLRVSPEGAVTPVGTVTGVAARGEGGLLGVAVSPAFATDRAVFVYYTSATDNRVVRLRVAADGTIDGAAQQVLVSGIPAASIHNGGGLAFGPDGLLYVATGDAGRGAAAQDLGDLGGKILRITPDGAPAAGNPFGTAVFTYGHRNVQGLAFGPDGRMYATEFGQNRVDEINRITPGANYGWPTVEGIGHRAGLTDPLLTWTTSAASPSGLAYAGGSLWAGALRGQRLWRVPLASGGTGGAEPVGTPQPLFTHEFGRLRAVVATPDGSALWITTSNRDGRGSPTAEDDRILVVRLS
ncbi:PQQ-dependent sugar dehydrogenase [Pseudonocardia hispaniensis]|uniref:PQQ-dependent sugar dehydrogenase n=1 Tax=Pseudonocardia hispaniensis TaxID=904933 RepID=A0ABW1J3Z0_9PSEU